MATFIFQHSKSIPIRDIYYINNHYYYTTSERNAIYRATGKDEVFYKSTQIMESILYCNRKKAFIIWEGDKILEIGIFSGKVNFIYKVTDEVGILLVNKNGIIHILNYKMKGVTVITQKNTTRQEFTEINFHPFESLQKGVFSKSPQEIFLFDNLTDMLTKVNLITGKVTFLIHEQMLPIYNISGMTVDYNDHIYLCGMGSEIVKITDTGKWTVVYRDDKWSPECLGWNWKDSQLIVGTTDGQIIQIDPYQSDNLPYIHDLSIYELHRLKEKINLRISQFHTPNQKPNLTGFQKFQ